MIRHNPDIFPFIPSDSEKDFFSHAASRTKAPGLLGQRRKRAFHSLEHAEFEKTHHKYLIAMIFIGCLRYIRI